MQSAPLPLVLVPGLVCDDAVWKAQIAAFSLRRRVIVADHKNLDSLADMAREVLARAPERFALVGHSMGGRVALEIMRVAPERVRQLALLDTGFAPRASGEAGEQEAAKRYALLDIAKTQGMRPMGIEWARGMVHPDRLSDAALMNEIHDMIARKTVEQFAAQIRALLGRPDAADVLAAIRCPTLVLCGRQDSWSPWEQHVEIARRIRNSGLVAIEHCGHMSTMERPEEATAALRAFLDAGRNSLRD
jgi:pimeloyl-ACP methyl ester carboxylesterase